MIKKLLPSLLPIVLVAMILACEKPKPLQTLEESEVARMSFVTSLNDTIPEKTISDLKINQIVEGLKVKYHAGAERRYFKYEAEIGNVLKAFREMPFELSDARSDVQLIKVTFEEMKLAHDYAPDESLEFWNTENLTLDAYECIKGGVKHQLLVNRTTKLVLHRVVYS